MRPILKVEYLLNNSNMSDEELENQKFRTFYVTEDMLMDLVFQEDNSITSSDEIDEDNFYIYTNFIIPKEDKI